MYMKKLIKIFKNKTLQKSIFILSFVFLFSVSEINTAKAGSVVDAISEAFNQVVSIASGVVQGTFTFIGGGNWDTGYAQGWCNSPTPANDDIISPLDQRTCSGIGGTVTNDCPTGKWANINTGYCTPCLEGTYSNMSNSSSCTSCPLGEYQNEQGRTSCNQCPVGKSTIYTGSKSIDSCITINGACGAYHNTILPIGQPRVQEDLGNISNFCSGGLLGVNLNNEWTSTSQSSGTFLRIIKTKKKLDNGNYRLLASKLVGGILKSDDYGITWTQTNQSSVVFKSFLDTGSYILAGALDGIYKSTDNGNTWTQTGQSSGYFEYLTNTNSAIIAVASDGIYKSTDNGDNWTKKSTWESDYAHSVINLGDYILSGVYDGIYKSTDNGENWSKIGGSPRGIYSFTEIGSDILASNWQSIYKSSDRGNTWTLQWSVESYYLYSIINIGQELLGLTSNGIHRSTDKGVNWFKIGNSNASFRSVINSTGTQLLAATNDGIKKYSIYNPDNQSYSINNWQCVGLTTLSGVNGSSVDCQSNPCPEGYNEDTSKQDCIVDSDNNGLIDIINNSNLSAVKHNLSGTSYKPYSTSSRVYTGGCPFRVGSTTERECHGYELFNNIDLTGM